jgi:hypothetical protein
LSYYSSETISLSSSSGWARCWFTGVSDLLESVGIQIDCLPPFRYSLDTLGHLLMTRQMLNKIIRDDIYRQFIQLTWVNPLGGLCPKMAFYTKHFLELSDGFIVRPHYTLRHWVHALRILLGQCNRPRTITPPKKITVCSYLNCIHCPGTSKFTLLG